MYRIVYGGTTYLITSGQNQVSHNNEVYLPYVISHGEVSSRAELSKNTLEVNLELTHPLSDLLKSPQTVERPSLALFRKYGADVSVWWKGRMSVRSVEDNFLKMSWDSLFSSLVRPGLRRVCSRSCPHAVYSQGCGVGWPGQISPPQYGRNILALSPDKLRVQISIADFVPEYIPKFFNWGVISKGESASLIMSARYLTAPIMEILLSKPARWAAVGDSVLVRPGCDKSLAQCHDRFSNHLNFGGQPWIPLSNPFSGSDSL